LIPVADAKGVTIEGRVGDGPPELRASPPELLRALRNILENAVRHTPSDGSVVVEAAVHGDEAVVSIADS
jgi:signal transduction histidine kinase